MFDKLKYKLWKHISKNLVANGRLAANALSNIHYIDYFQQHSDFDLQPGKYATKELSTKIIDVRGMLYSGSSAVVGLLNEFDCILSTGFPDKSWSKNIPQTTLKECTFFSASGFCEMIQAFRQATIEECNQKIRIFLGNISKLYSEQGLFSWDKIPPLYGEEFRKITQRFLYTILDLDEYTKEFMNDKVFPVICIEREVQEFANCSFMKLDGKKAYYFYQFAPISHDALHAAVSEYLNDFLCLIPGSQQYTAFDQLLPREKLDFVNLYVKPSIKQVFVIRDPRDQYLSAFRHNNAELPSRAIDWAHFYKAQIAEHPIRTPYRLIIRFEDLVLKYNETIAKIMEFIGVDAENHVSPKSVFDPAISVANIGAYRHYHNQPFMHDIESLLSDYCYYPEREKLSDESLALLRSSGNWSNL